MTTTTWMPPDNPNPSEILSSAVDDTRASLYAQALTKHLWFHHNALKYDDAQYGVRLSFALGSWLELAALYTPAKDALIQTREETEAVFRQNPGFDLFYDVVSLNRCLRDEIRTADLFAEVANRDHDAARGLYQVAEPHLIATGRYRECGPFLDTSERLMITAASYRVSTQCEDSTPERDIPIPKFARQRYVENVATFLALLVVNNRAGDARIVYDRAVEIMCDDDFRTTLNAAMTGHFPDRG